MTPHIHLHTRAARRPATSSDASALLGQDVTLELRSNVRSTGSKGVILVILHYLLKNNITFMGVMCRGNRGGATASSQRVLLTWPLAHDWRID